MQTSISTKTNSILLALIALFAFAIPASASAARPGAVVFSRLTETTEPKKAEGEAPKVVTEGGLFAIREGRLNQLTEDPTDTEPAFAPDGRTIAFVRGGHLFSVRPDGSGQRQLTSGPTLDSAPLVSPDGKLVVFERRDTAGGPADLYVVRTLGGGLRALVTSPADEHDADFAANGRAVAFVRSGAGSDDVYSVRPSGARLVRLTKTAGTDEFEPRYFAGGIVFSRGESATGPAAFADIYTMRADGANVKPLVRGVGSAYVEDVAVGHTLLFRRDRGLWVKRIGSARARKLADLPDNSQTNSVFSSDGRRVAAFVAAEEREYLVSIDVANGRQSDLAEGVDLSEGEGTTLGPVMTWQPTR